MTSANSRQTLLAINSTEWLNLCARGSIRMSKRRPVVVSNAASEREMERVFAAAPFTKLDSSVDLFVLTLDNDWAKTKRGHRSYPSEILQLNLSDIKNHHPVALEHFEYYNNIGSKCGIYLSESIFEKAWVYWITNETIRASSDAADSLQRAFNVRPSSETKRTDKYKWDDIARLVLRPNEAIKAKAAHVETLLSNIRKIADAVSSTRDSEQFYLACVVEWIDVRLNKDPLKNKAIKDTLLAALANARELPLNMPGEQTAAALKLLAETFPKAFTDEISPVSVAQMVQLLTGARTKNLKPEAVIRIIQSQDPSSTTSTFSTFVLATALGIELTNQLIFALNQKNPIDMNWDIPT